MAAIAIVIVAEDAIIAPRGKDPTRGEVRGQRTEVRGKGKR
jgi:hypothetical protein